MNWSTKSINFKKRKKNTLRKPGAFMMLHEARADGDMEPHRLWCKTNKKKNNKCKKTPNIGGNDCRVEMWRYRERHIEMKQELCQGVEVGIWKRPPWSTARLTNAREQRRQEGRTVRAAATVPQSLRNSKTVLRKWLEAKHHSGSAVRDEPATLTTAGKPAPREETQRLNQPRQIGDMPATVNCGPWPQRGSQAPGSDRKLHSCIMLNKHLDLKFMHLTWRGESHKSFLMHPWPSKRCTYSFFYAVNLS